VDRKPAASETNATGPFLSVGEVSVFALEGDRFRLVSPELALAARRPVCAAVRTREESGA